MDKKKAYYDLNIVKEKVKRNEIQINKNAALSAQEDFKWESEDIKRVYLKLRSIHFDITDQNKNNHLYMDTYKIRNVDGEDVYTHFYINVFGTLIISSFKRLKG